MNAVLKDIEEEKDRLRLELFVYKRINVEFSFEEWSEKMSGWDFIPVRNPDNVLVAVITRIRNEIHVVIDQDYKGKWLSRRILRDIGGEILSEYGEIKTCITPQDKQAKHFVERLGFKKVEPLVIDYVFNGDEEPSRKEKLNEVDTRLSSIDGNIIKKLFTLEDELKKLPQVDLNVKHYFSKGLCAREMTMPKDTLGIGRVHRYSQVNTISKGDISILTENGWKRMKAPCTFESKAGAKRAAYTHEDTVWTTYIGTEETDVDNIVDLMTIGSYQEYLKVKDNLLIGEKK